MRAVFAAMPGLLLAVGSSFVAAGRAVAVHPDVMGCERGCAVAASGWPRRYTHDYPGLSVVGRADAFEAWLGSDRFDAAAFALDWLVWATIGWVAIAAIGAAWRRNSRSAPDQVRDDGWV